MPRSFRPLAGINALGTEVKWRLLLEMQGFRPLAGINALGTSCTEPAVLYVERSFRPLAGINALGTVENDEEKLGNIVVSVPLRGLTLLGLPYSIGGEIFHMVFPSPCGD